MRLAAEAVQESSMRELLAREAKIRAAVGTLVGINRHSPRR